jgi:hypothetical protein
MSSIKRTQPQNGIIHNERPDGKISYGSNKTPLPVHHQNE